MGRGRYAEAATYEGSEKVSGVVVSPEDLEIHIVARYPLPRPIPEIAENIRERVAPQAGGRRTRVVVEDLEVGEDERLYQDSNDTAVRRPLRARRIPGRLQL
jgi:hypothetical protein